jgi:hypothetical protein
MSLADDLTAKVLTLDIETQRAVVETWNLFKPFIGINQVIRPTRILCVAAKWRGDEKVLFKAAWDDDDDDAYLAMMTAVAGWLDRADVLVTYNGQSFDEQWIVAEISRLGIPKPSPWRSIDLYRVNKRNFGAGQMSKKLEWSARRWLKDTKASHGGRDLWYDIRYGTNAARKTAQKTMREYNIHDVQLTEQLLQAWLPYTRINLAVYGRIDDETLRCPTCGSTHVSADGEYATNAATYTQYRCEGCGSHSRGKRGRQRTELRPV